MTIEIKNAVITSAYFNAGGYLSAWLHLDYGGVFQKFGGHMLYLPKSSGRRPCESNYTGHWIWRVLEIAGVDDWAKLPGKTIRVKADKCNVFSIGHIVKEDWFDPEKEFEELRAQNI